MRSWPSDNSIHESLEERESLTLLRNLENNTYGIQKANVCGR